MRRSAGRSEPGSSAGTRRPGRVGARLHPSGPRPSRALLPDTPAVASVQPLREADLAHRGHDPPFERPPPTVWFAAIHPVVTARNGIPSVEPGHRLGVGQATARTMRRRIMAVMARRKALAGPRRRGRDRRPRPCRPQPPGDPQRLRARGGPNGALQTGQHHTRKHRKRDHRNLPEARPRPCPGFVRRCSRRHHLRTMIPRFPHGAARTWPIPSFHGPHRRLTFADDQECDCPDPE